MMIEGKQKCEYSDCGKEFEWYHIIAQSIDTSFYKVHKIPTDKEPIYSVIEMDENRFPTKVNAYCPHCGRLNIFNI